MESLIFFQKSLFFHMEFFVFSDNRVISNIVSFGLFYQSYDIVLSLLQIILNGLLLKIQVSDLLFQHIFFLLDDAYLSIWRLKTRLVISMFFFSQFLSNFVDFLVEIVIFLG